MASVWRYPCGWPRFGSGLQETLYLLDIGAEPLIHFRQILDGVTGVEYSGMAASPDPDLGVIPGYIS